MQQGCTRLVGGLLQQGRAQMYDKRFVSEWIAVRPMAAAARLLQGTGSSHGLGEPGGVRTDLRVIFTFIIIFMVLQRQRAAAVRR